MLSLFSLVLRALRRDAGRSQIARRRRLDVTLSQALGALATCVVYQLEALARAPPCGWRPGLARAHADAGSPLDVPADAIDGARARIAAVLSAGLLVQFEYAPDALG